MTRWNVLCIFFIGEGGRRREISLKPDEVNIITGASGTGKSTLIKAVDYCLGASRCELPAHVRRRCLAVGVKWGFGHDELVVGRLVPPVGQVSSSRMFVTAGKNLNLPSRIEEFQGATTVDAAKAYLERAFGIGDLGSDPELPGQSRGRATVRLITPYLFVTKEVIYSETVLLHGLERPDEGRDIIATMPYFLGATDNSTAVDERRLRQLQKTLEREEVRLASQARTSSSVKERALSLLKEAERLGLLVAPQAMQEEGSLISELEKVAASKIDASAYPNEQELAALHRARKEILTALSDARRSLEATREAMREAAGFESAVSRQRKKLALAEHLGVDRVRRACPVCEAESDRGVQTALALNKALERMRGESAAVERVKPKLAEHDRTLESRVTELNERLRAIDDQIRTWLSQHAQAKSLSDLAQVRSHLMGRISFFLDTLTDHALQPTQDLAVLRAEIAAIESRIDREAREVKLRRAERKVSEYASQAFALLPTVAPCVGSELEFSARRPDVSVIEGGSGAVLRMPDVGSDQNYLAIHVALSFALHRHFELIDAPVPGFLVLDQISRPYFPASGEDTDEAEISSAGEGDDDLQAMRMHIDFLFNETARRRGLQVLLIEHAFFRDDPRYVSATRERWTRASGKALIPVDWPVRAVA